MSTTPFKTLCVYCAASGNIDDKYKDLARDLGTMIGAQDMDMVYGGSNSGLMGITATAALAGGAQVTGVIPKDLEEKEVAHTGLSALHVTDSMHERQMKMVRLSDGFIILPGGLGTMAEFFEVVTWKQLQFHAKPIFLLNAFGYWDPMIAMINQAGTEGFLHGQTENIFEVLTTLDQLPALLKTGQNKK